MCPGKRVVVLESRLLGSGQTGRAVGDMTTWHLGLFSSLERYTSTEQRKQVSSMGLPCAGVHASQPCQTGLERFFANQLIMKL